VPPPQGPSPTGAQTPKIRINVPTPDPAARFSAAPFIVIALIVGGLAALFAYTAGWLSPRLGPDQMVDALGERGGDPTGHRRNHAKGICFDGYFDANGAGAALSSAAMFSPGRYPVIGRFAIAVGNPLAQDATGRVRSMAIRIVAPNGQEWRSGMNNSPVFAVATAQAFYELTLAAKADPNTGKPNPEAVNRATAAHPETASFGTWAKSAPWTGSYADQTYSSLNAFQFVNGSGEKHAVRWAMVAVTPMTVVSPEDLKTLPADFLEKDLNAKLGQQELRWHLVATLAQPDDPTNDATKAWPTDRRQVILGELVVQHASDEANGACRDYNYDPLILPRGIEASDDPLLSARSAAYAESFDRRMQEAGSSR
jgi:catalase